VGGAGADGRAKFLALFPMARPVVVREGRGREVQLPGGCGKGVNARVLGGRLQGRGEEVSGILARRVEGERGSLDHGFWERGLGVRGVT
jgi:hypothetical protein